MKPTTPDHAPVERAQFLCPDCCTPIELAHLADPSRDCAVFTVRLHGAEWPFTVTASLIARSPAGMISECLRDSHPWFKDNPDCLRYIFTEVARGAGNHGDFLRAVAMALQHADRENFALLEPVARRLVCKYDLLGLWKPGQIGE